MATLANYPSIATLCHPHHARHRYLPTVSASYNDSPPPQQSSSITRRQFISLNAAAVAAVTLHPLGNKALSVEDPLSVWERVYLPIDPGVVLLDIAFVPDDLSHGFMLGTRQTILETKDGGNTWVSRSIPSAEDEDFNCRFNSISFKGKEGWIVGKPAILLYTDDAGETWKRVPLIAQLPGDMKQPHNRAVSRRIQNMGWRADGGLWLLVRGGGLYLSKGTGITEDFEEVQVQSRGFGILDVGYRSQDEA